MVVLTASDREECLALLDYGIAKLCEKSLANKLRKIGSMELFVLLPLSPFCHGAF